MILLFWFSIAVFAVSITACAALTIPFSRLTESGRKNLDLATRQRGHNMAVAAGICLIPAMLILALWKTTNPDMQVAAWSLLLPFGAWAFALWRYQKNAPTFDTPDGQESDYDTIKAKFPHAAITCDEQYHQGMKFLQDCNDHDRLAQRCGNRQERLTMTQWRFLHELQDMVYGYAERYPRLKYGQEWYDQRQAQVRELETLLKQATALQGGKTNNVGALEHLDEANDDLFYSLAQIKDTLEGNFEYNRRGPVDYLFDEIERTLAKRITHAREAIRLFEAEAQGQIKYETPARVLIAQAGREKKDFGKAVELLKQAIAQGKTPDSDTRPVDLVHALCGLALVYHHHLDRHAEAEALYLEALALQESLDGREHDHVAETLGRLSSVAFAQEKLPEALSYARKQVAMLSRQLPYHLSNTIRAQEWVAKVLVKGGQLAEAEKMLRLNLALCVKHDHGMASGLDTIGAYDELIAFLDGQQRYEEAAELVDRVIRFQSGSTYGEFKSPTELRVYGRVLRAVGLDEEVEAFQLEERALATEAEYARYKDREPGTWSALEDELEERLLDEI